MRHYRTLGFALVSSFVVGLVGCSEEAGVKEKTTVTAPSGDKTTVTKETKVETSGSNPPAPATAPTGAGATKTP